MTAMFRWISSLLRACKAAFLELSGPDDSPRTPGYAAFLARPANGLHRVDEKRNTLPWKRSAKLLRRKVRAWQATSAGWRGECMEAERQVRKLEEKLELTNRCAFCGVEFGHGETILWMPDFRRGYCTACRDEIDAAEREEREREAKAGEYGTRGVAKGDFYR